MNLLFTLQWVGGMKVPLLWASSLAHFIHLQYLIIFSLFWDWQEVSENAWKGNCNIFIFSFSYQHQPDTIRLRDKKISSFSQPRVMVNEHCASTCTCYTKLLQCIFTCNIESLWKNIVRVHCSLVSSIHRNMNTHVEKKKEKEDVKVQ